VKIALTGDVMLGRAVDHYVVQNSSVTPQGLWGDVLPVLLSADLRLINLECVISSRGVKWRPLTKPFHFRAHPRAVEFLKVAKVDCVTLANNHILDYGVEALEECLELLQMCGIKGAGAGRNLREAEMPVVVEGPAGRVAIVSLTDNEPEWEAQENYWGVNFVDYDTRGLVEPYRSRIARVLLESRSQADWVIISAHVGPNWGKPSAAMRALAYNLLDLGGDLYWGHSNHSPQGIEVYDKKLILYSTGDFIDDYAVDPIERNDLSFLFVLEAEQDHIQKISLYATVIEDFRARRAGGKEVDFLQQQMRSRSAEFGSHLETQDCALHLSVA
jgi:poly-gamma-glutamate capsule biosynthesis protein CapA/YwtB (metallophosphatase superfamily)